jgi:hypothetical protein
VRMAPKKNAPPEGDALLNVYVARPTTVKGVPNLEPSADPILGFANYATYRQ